MGALRREFDLKGAVRQISQAILGFHDEPLYYGSNPVVIDDSLLQV